MGIKGKYNSIKECLEKNRGAYLGGVKNYSEQHGIFQEVIRQQSLKLLNVSTRRTNDKLA